MKFLDNNMTPAYEYVLEKVCQIKIRRIFWMESIFSQDMEKIIQWV